MIEPGSEKFLPLAKRKVQAHFERLQRGTSKDVPGKQVFEFENTSFEITYLGRYQWRVNVVSAATPNAWKIKLHLVAERKKHEQILLTPHDSERHFHDESDFLVVVSGGYEGKPYACWGITVVTFAEKAVDYDHSVITSAVAERSNGTWDAGTSSQSESMSLSYSWDGLVPQLTLFASGSSMTSTEVGAYDQWLGDTSLSYWQEFVLADSEQFYTKVWNKPLKHGLLVKQFDEKAKNLKDNLLVLFAQAPRVTMSEADLIVSLKSVRTGGMHDELTEEFHGSSSSSTYTIHDRIQRYLDTDEHYLRAFHGITDGHPSYETSHIVGRARVEGGRDAMGSANYLIPARFAPSYWGWTVGFNSDKTFGGYWEILLSEIAIPLHYQVTETCGGSRPTTALVFESYPSFPIGNGLYWYYNGEPTVARPTPLPYVYRTFTKEARLVEGKSIHALSADSVFQGEPTQGIAVLPSRIVLWGTQLTLKTITLEQASAYLAKYPVGGPKLIAALRQRLKLS